jgi:hypothetical protein
VIIKSSFVIIESSSKRPQKFICDHQKFILGGGWTFEFLRIFNRGDAKARSEISIGAIVSKSVVGACERVFRRQAMSSFAEATEDEVKLRIVVLMDKK